MVDILQQIVASKRPEVEMAKEKVPLITLEKRIKESNFPKQSLAKSLLTKPGIIAEFKRASPSKGVINNSNTVAQIVGGYNEYGASGISMLTDSDFFKANKDDFEIARTSTNKPLLRKEFIVDAYQIYESKSMGANVILLIAAILSKAEIIEFVHIAHGLELEVLIELHAESEIEKLSGFEDIIGVNNRNLKTFEVDIKQSILIKNKIGNIVSPIISESGLSSIGQIEKLLKVGFNGFLMGEYFMKQKDPIVEFTNFNKALRALKI